MLACGLCISRKSGTGGGGWDHPSENADYCMFINEWVWLKSHVYIKSESALAFSFGIRALTEMKIQCIKGMCMLQIVKENIRC